MLAVSMPGRNGDALYALPTIRELYRRTGLKSDFYTSEYCRPLEELFLYQECINDFIIPENYTITDTGCGVQPWKMPIDRSKYDAVYQLGFKSWPDIPLHQFMARDVNIHEDLPIKYDYPDMDEGVSLPDEFVCIASYGHTSWDHHFRVLADHIPVVTIGGKGEYIDIGIDATGIDFLETLSILSKAKGFVGLMSSQLVLANGFPIPKVAMYNGQGYDMRHVVRSPYNHYPISPSPEQVLRLLGVS